MRTTREVPVASWQRLNQRLMRRLTVVQMSPDRVEELCAFFARAYADQPIAEAFQDQARIRQRWAWLSHANPLALEDGLPSWVCLKGDQIVGHWGMVPALAVSRGRLTPICWGRDFIASPEARQYGVGPLLLVTVVTALKRPVLVAGLNDTSFSIVQRLGFLDGGRVPLYLKAYQPHRLLEAVAWPGTSRGLIAASVRAAQQILKRRPRRRMLSIVPMERFDERFDQWWTRLEESLGCVVRRTSATMTWRYHQHPAYRYTTLAAMDRHGLRGVVTLRHGRSKGLSAGFITELLVHPHDMEAAGALIESAERTLLIEAPEPLVFLRCTLRHRMLARALWAAGFLRVPSATRFVLSHVEGLGALGDLAQLNAWCLNGGDADLDLL